MTRKIFYLLGLILITPNFLYSQEEKIQLKLTELMDSAIHNNYLLRATDKNTMIKMAEIEILKTNYQPVINSSASFSYWKFLLPNKQRLLGDALTDLYTDLSVYQTVYDWGENKARKSMVGEEIKLNDEVLRQIRNTIILGVADAYFEVLKAESQLEANEIALQQLESHLQYAQNLYQIGKVSGLDVLKINVQISIIEKTLQKTQSEVSRQKIKLRRLCNLNENIEISIEDSSEELYLLSMNEQYKADSIYYLVLQNHPSVLALDQKANIEKTQKEVYRLQSFPEFYSYGIASWEHGYIPFGKNFNYNIGLGLRYTIPFWGGSSFKSRMTQSDYRISQINDEKEQAFLDLKTEIDLTINKIFDTKMEISSNEKIIALSDETMKNAIVKYQAGQGPIIDVLDAQVILTETIIAQNNSLITYLQHLSVLHYLSGNDNYPF